MGKSYHLKEQKISYKKNAFLEDHGGGEDIPMLGAGLYCFHDVFYDKQYAFLY